MRTTKLEGVCLRRRHRTTVADQSAAKAPDLIGRDFTAAAVNTKYVDDITYLPVNGAKPLYVATVIDLCSRRLAGWAIGDHMRTELVIDALAAAERTRGSLAGAVMHTDHGSQYTSRAFAEICRSAGVRQSMGTVGSSADNAAAESFNAAFTRETLKGRKGWSSEREARLDAFRWLTRYNTDAGTPASVNAPRSPARTPSEQQQLPWPKPYRRVQNPGSGPARSFVPCWGLPFVRRDRPHEPRCALLPKPPARLCSWSRLGRDHRYSKGSYDRVGQISAWATMTFSPLKVTAGPSYSS